MKKYNKIQDALLGIAVGDALGVPFEFNTTDQMKKNPAKDMIGYGTNNQAPGTWSDDSSMMLCLLESLTKKYDVEDIGQTFVKWYQHGYWGAHHTLFDIGNTTRDSLDRIIKGTSTDLSGNFFEESNGNGSLMRTLPLAFFLKDETDIEELYKKVKEVSSITHAHFRSNFSCFIYIIFAIELLKKKTI